MDRIDVTATVAHCASGLIPSYLDNNYKWYAAETFDATFLPGAHPTLVQKSRTL